MAYKAIHIHLEPVSPEFSEILIALLDAYDFEGVHERDDIIDTYFASDNFNPDWLEVIQSSLLSLGCRMAWKVEEIADQNWNSLWESKFEPVIIDKRCAIRAPFHPQFTDIEYELIIEPKMAFGTGHHQTTRLMIMEMLESDFRNKKVLDMGCGTGVLGILASIMGAGEVVSVDIDRWACENTTENAVKNGINNIRVIQGSSNALPENSFDIILANINRNILLSQMTDYARHTRKNSLLMISGILEEDSNTVNHSAVKAQFSLLRSNSLDKWIVMVFQRK